MCKRNRKAIRPASLLEFRHGDKAGIPSLGGRKGNGWACSSACRVGTFYASLSHITHIYCSLPEGEKEAEKIGGVDRVR